MMLGGRTVASRQLSKARPESAAAPISAVAKSELCRICDTKKLSNGGPESAGGSGGRTAVARGSLFAVAATGILPILRLLWEMRCEHPPIS